MSNETMEAEKKELDEMEAQLIQEAEAKKAKAEKVEEGVSQPDPSPEPVQAKAPEAVSPEPAPVTQETSNVEPEKPTEDNPMEWAKKKGFKSPEDMARALLQKEQEFHQSRQKDERKIQFPPPAPAAPTWQPQPDMGYGYQPRPAYPGRDPFMDLAAQYPQIDPEDLKRFMPVVVDAAKIIARGEVMGVRSELEKIQRSTARNNELMSLMQDPAFTDPIVQQEIHGILETDKSAFQRDGAYTNLFRQALENLARKQLQQKVAQGSPSIPGNMPPVTAGGGNGSAFAGPRKITEQEFERWSVKDQEAFISSNGRILPKK